MLVLAVTRVSPLCWLARTVAGRRSARFSHRSQVWSLVPAAGDSTISWSRHKVHMPTRRVAGASPDECGADALAHGCAAMAKAAAMTARITGEFLMALWR